MIDDGRFGRPVAMEELMGRVLHTCCLLATEEGKAKHLLSESSHRDTPPFVYRAWVRFYAALRVPIFVYAR